jgi:Cd2+/Zn2+-exporting ATPase
MALNFQSTPGAGVSAIVDRRRVRVGTPEFALPDGVPAEVASVVVRERADGRTAVVVSADGAALGVLAVADALLPDARSAVEQLRMRGIAVSMASGDDVAVARRIASEVGIDQVHAGVLPDGKARVVEDLRSAGRCVAMVGDGVNDAPAMASATVGIAMGAAGSDVALETADVALMADDLAHLPFAVGLSRHTRWIIRQNVFVSLGVVAFLVPATILGLGIGPAVAVHEGSTLLVVINALRLLAYRDPAGKAA